MGKGSRIRTVKHQQFRDNFEDIFKKDDYYFGIDMAGKNSDKTVKSIVINDNGVLKNIGDESEKESSEWWNTRV